MVEHIGQSVIYLGIVTQLYDSRMNKLLSAYQLTLSQFSLLSHLLRHPNERHTISGLTEAMQLNQPAISKIVQKLSQAGWLSIEKDAKDSRKKWISLNEQGRELIRKVTQELAPDIRQWFADWSEEEIAQFLSSLQKLTHWLDENRLE